MSTYSTVMANCSSGVVGYIPICRQNAGILKRQYLPADMVCATWSPAPAGSSTPTSLGNHISHLVTIRANCGDEVCATLFPPTFHWCGIWWLIALRENMAQKMLPNNALPAAENALKAVDALLKQLPQDAFTQNMLKITEQKPRPQKTHA